MASETKAQRLAKVHADALADFNSIQAVARPQRMEALEDRRFASVTGAMWEGQWGEQFANRPKLEVNKVALSVMRLFSEWRANRITVDFVPKDGTEADALAEACNGLYRADEDNSNAQEAFDNAFEEGVSGGMGAWRLRAEYDDDDDPENTRQRIMIEPIFDADSCVYFDLGSKRQDKSDAKRCYVLTGMPKDAYMEEYGDDPATWPQSVATNQFDWAVGDTVYIAELYKIEEKKTTVYTYKTLVGQEVEYTDQDFENNEELESELAQVGTTLDRQRKIKIHRVHKYVMSGGSVLEDCGYIAGKHIPIVPVYGKRWFIEGIERFMGQVRLAKDVQRLSNMQMSKMAELTAFSSVEKPIFTPEQIAGHELTWADDNISDNPYLLINPATDMNGQSMPMGPVGYTKPPQVPPVMAALMAASEQAIQDVLGNQQAGEQVDTQMSGRAVELVQNRLDMQSFIYLSNMAKAVRRGGEVWLSMARELYVEPGRKMKTMDDQGTAGSLELGEQVIKDGVMETRNDIGEASFDVKVDVGPVSSSKRASTLRAMMALMAVTQDPQTQTILGAYAIMNTDSEGSSDLRKYARKQLVAMGVIPMNEEEQKEAANQPPPEPDPQAILAQSLAVEAQSKAQLAASNATKAEAQTKESQAKTAEILAGISRDDRAQVISTIEQLSNLESATAQPMNGRV